MHIKEKPYETKVEKSRGKAVYVKGLRVWEDNDRIHVSSTEGNTYCPKDSSIERFFRKFIKK